jgi:hypothetical protein
MASYRLLSSLSIALMTVACTDSGSSQCSASLVDIGGGRKMSNECDGAGTPTVLLISGKGDRADTWSTNHVDPSEHEAMEFRQVVRGIRQRAVDGAMRALG